MNECAVYVKDATGKTPKGGGKKKKLSASEEKATPVSPVLAPKI